MKNFYNIAYEIKALMALFFTGIIVIYGLVSLFLGNKTMSLELMWEFILLSVIIGGIQIILYGERVFNNVSNRVKIVFHYLILLVIIIGFIQYFNWVELWGISFSLLIIIFTVSFTAITLNFYFYKRITGERFNDKLLRYKEKL